MDDSRMPSSRQDGGERQNRTEQPSAKQLRQTRLARLNRCHAGKQFRRIVEEISAIPQNEWGYELTMHLARACNNLGEYAKAAEWLQSVRQEGENDAGWHFHMGAALYYLGRKRLAKNGFERVLELDPDDSSARQYLAWCCDTTGDTSPLLADGTSTVMPPTNTPHARHRYTGTERAAVENHITACFGEYGALLHDPSAPDIAIIEPTAQRPFRTLVTIGMGASKMNLPASLRTGQPDRAELLICLPASWDIDSKDEKWHWPLRWLKTLARLPAARDIWLGWGHTVPNDIPFADNTGLSAFLLIHPGLFSMEKEPGDCILPDGDAIRFYQIVPLYPDELAYLQTYGADRLITMLDEDAVIIDHRRPHACLYGNPVGTPGRKNKPANPLADWQGPQGCLATDRIIIDGCKVGYMYREEPDKDMPDSGWRFTAGDESPEYMADPCKTGIYPLDTLCGLDPDIIPLLDSPCGTAWFRDGTGQFRPLPCQPDGSGPLH